MSASTRVTVSIRLRERQLIETIHALEDVDTQTMDKASEEAIVSALAQLRAALQRLQDRVR